MGKKNFRQTGSQKPFSRYEDTRLALAKLHAVEGGSLRGVFQDVCKIAAHAFEIARVGIWLYADDRRKIQCYQLYEPRRNNVYEGTVLHQADFPDYFKALETTRVIPVSDAQGDRISQQFHDAYFIPLGITSMLDAPIYRGGTVVGVVCHEHIGSLREWSESECDLAVTVADTIARLYEEAGRLQAESFLGVYQNHIMEMQRLDTLGRLAVGVAHDFRNVLSTIATYCTVIANSKDATPEILENVQGVLEASQRGSNLARELMKYGQDSPNSPSVIDLSELLEKFKNFLKMSLRHNVSLKIDQCAQLSRVFADRSQIERVLMNLVNNAQDAMPNGGEIRIAVSEKILSQETGRQGIYDMIEIYDNGTGMSEETRKKIFEPFFTTKGDKGSGLGLAIVHQIVTYSGGFIEVESQVGKGSCFRIYLPCIAGNQNSYE